VKMSSDHQIIVLFSETVVAESSGDVRILTGSSKIAVCAHVNTVNSANSSTVITFTVHGTTQK